MAFNVEIKCIKKDDRYDPHERIQRVGGVNANGNPWSLSLDDAIAGIRADKYSFWTAGGGKSVWVVIAERHGREYLKTTSDGDHPNNLLSLPQCP